MAVVDLAKDIAKVARIMDRMAPRVERYMRELIEKDGHSVAMSVATNISTSVLAYVLIKVENHGSNAEKFLEMMIQDICSKAAAGQHMMMSDEVRH